LIEKKLIVGLGDNLNTILAMEMRNAYYPEVYNNDHEATSKVSTTIADAIRNSGSKYFRGCCWVCGKTKNQLMKIYNKPVDVTIAHIIKTKKLLREKFNLGWDASNFLFLCGTQGAIGTCYDYFSNFQMSFMYKNEKVDEIWIVLGGPYSGKEVVLHSKPHKRTLYSHLTRCIINKSLLKSAQEINFEDLE
jgi:hypothetical protein